MAFTFVTVPKEKIQIQTHWPQTPDEEINQSSRSENGLQTVRKLWNKLYYYCWGPQIG